MGNLRHLDKVSLPSVITYGARKGQRSEAQTSRFTLEETFPSPV